MQKAGGGGGVERLGPGAVQPSGGAITPRHPHARPGPATSRGAAASAAPWRPLAAPWGDAEVRPSARRGRGGRRWRGESRPRLMTTQ